MEIVVNLAGINLFVMEVVAVVILGAVLLWAVMRTRSKGKDSSNPRTEEATRELYQAEDEALKRHVDR